jgi:hypothetical protein
VRSFLRRRNPGATTYRVHVKSSIVFAVFKASTQIFRKEAGIPDVPGG